MARTPFPLGRIQRHDPRSRGFAAPVLLPVEHRAWRRYGDVLDQGSLGSCTGNAGTHALNSAPLHVVGTSVKREPYAVELYSAATAIDEFTGTYPPDDTGSSALGVCKVLLSRTRISRYEWAFGFDHFLSTMMLGPVMCGTTWYDGMFYPDSHGVIRPTGADVGGHEYLCSGVSVTNRMLRFQNSWGSGWGDYGKFYMTFDDFASLLAAGGDAVRLVS